MARKDYVKDEAYHDRRRMRKLCEEYGINPQKFYPKNERKSKSRSLAGRAKTSDERDS